MKLSQFLKRMEITKNQSLQRELILDAWQNCEQFFIGLQFSVDPQYQVCLTKVPELQEDDGFEGTFTMDKFIHLFEKATDPNADPAEIRILALDAANESNFYEWNLFYRKILLKRLHDDMPMDLITNILSELTGFEKPL